MLDIDVLNHEIQFKLCRYTESNDSEKILEAVNDLSSLGLVFMLESRNSMGPLSTRYFQLISLADNIRSNKENANFLLNMFLK